VIVLDTSAVVAIILGEPEAEEFRKVIALAKGASMSAASWFECAMVLHGRDAALVDVLRQFLTMTRIAVVPVDAANAARAYDAFRRYGRGSGHPARVNFGDCFAYALASSLRAPLLFKGDDFAATDVGVAASA
jgi:ribonuclease VapC